MDREKAVGRVSFDTPFGQVTLAFDHQAILGLELGGGGHKVATVEPGNTCSVPGFVSETSKRIRLYLKGEVQDFRDLPIACCMGDSFSSRAYRRLREVPAGETLSYGELARRAESPGGSRAAGQAVRANPVPLLIPCHRVLRSDGSLGGFSAPGGLYTKCRLLRLEGVTPMPGRKDHVFSSLFLPDAWDMAEAMLRRREPLFEALASKISITPIQQAFPGNPFAALVEAVIWQQLAGSVARVIFARVLGAYEELTVEAVLDRGEAPLVKAGLSGSKRRTILELAQALQEGRLSSAQLYEASSTDRTQALSAIWGIGPWTIQMFEMFHLGLPDISSPSDLGLRKAITKLVGVENLLSIERCQVFLDRMRPFRTVACQALWNSVDNPQA